MQREIKFRAWDKENKRIEPVYTLHASGAVHVRDGRVMLRADECVVMQFTGLRDAKSAEIYEGDILRNLDGGTGEVMWAVSGWIVNDGDHAHTYTWSQYEVIGSAFEHPELLTGHKHVWFPQITGEDAELEACETCHEVREAK